MKKYFAVLISLMLTLLLGFTLPPVSKPAGKVKSVTEWVTESSKGSPVTYKNEYEEYNRQGEMVMRVNYRKDGSVSEKDQYVFDKFGNRIEKISFEDQKGESPTQKYERLTWKYNAHREKTEECDYSRDGKLKSKTTFSYSADGRIVKEEVFNGEGKLKKVVAISYDKMKNVTQKVTTSAEGETIRVQKYVYELFK